jgi:carbamoyltransferase
MIFVCAHKFHDSSFSYYFENNLRYFKFERFLQDKHFDIVGSYHYKIDLENFLISYFKKKYNSEFQRVDWVNKVHHRTHTYSVEILENKKIDAHVVIDGLGDNGDVWCSIFRDNKIVDQKLTSISGKSFGDGLMYTARSLNISGHGLDLVGKLMGLQSYGNIDQDHYEHILKYNMDNLGLAVRGVKENKPHPWVLANNDNLYAVDCSLSMQMKINIAHTIHFRIGELVLDFFEKHFKTDERIGYSGGVAQNVVWNTLLKKKYPNLIIYPHCSDEGLTLGQIELFRRTKSLPKFDLSKYPFMQSDQAPSNQPTIDTIYKTAKFLNEGKIVAWYQGHGEIGPRALGHRSILMDPRIQNGKNIINRVKNREFYRPFGASVLSEYAKEYFDLDFENPYMLYLGNTQKDNLKAITHIDGTCRAQTVNESFDYAFRKLLECFHELSGCPVLLNTSLNEAGKPIAGWIDNAMNLFKSTYIDVLVIGDTIYKKQHV